MRRRIVVIALVCSILGLAGCNGDEDDDDSFDTFTTEIYSDPVFDGDIEQTGPNAFTVTQGMSATVQSVIAGIDPVAGSEFRAFLDFPLRDAGGVPRNALIDVAFLDLYVSSLEPITGRLPIRIDLVEFQPPTLIAEDFDRLLQPALASIVITPPITRADVGGYASIDVTPLMVEAQRLGLVDFQVRILQDLGPAIPVFMVIDDSTGAGRVSRGPVLTVTYF
jgi:hypothetical protein